MLHTIDIIKKKRDGHPLSREEFATIIKRYVDGEIPDYQMSSFLMACFIRGMDPEETFTFTEQMVHSGSVVDLSSIPGVKVDKHSTGGVGDKVSLLLAPIVAACGVPVPMISGRSLGHTGGTLDKLESIPGFRTDYSLEEYVQIIKDTNLVMIGQTVEIAPADKKMYALRDVTGTVECIPLMAGSILSKKIAEGIDALVLDVKTGKGAFMKNESDSILLAQTLVSIAERFGKETVAYITLMDEPLGSAIGNWLEVVESVVCLRSGGSIPESSEDLMEVTIQLSAAMVLLGKKAGTEPEARELAEEAVRNGSAYEKFLELVKRQGGSTDSIETLNPYPPSKHILEIHAHDEGYIQSIDAYEFGMISILLGAGRQVLTDTIDPKAGIVLKKKSGNRVEPGETIAVAYSDRESVLEEARTRLSNAVVIGRNAPVKRPPILSRITKDGVRTYF